MSLAGVLALVALVIVIIAETGRLPVDNPATHLELTMVHERWCSSTPVHGWRWSSGPPGCGSRFCWRCWRICYAVGNRGRAPRRRGRRVGVAAIVVKVAALAVLLAAAEVFMAKLRLFRVPELLAGSFLLALLSVTAANFFAAGA